MKVLVRKMKFYKIEYSTTKSEIGSSFPQSFNARHTVPAGNPGSIGNQEVGKPVVNVALPEPILHRGAILTDLISNTALSLRLLISPRLKKIVEIFASPESCQFLPVIVHSSNEPLSYWMINPIKFNMDQVDYANSTIWLESVGNTKIRQLNFRDFAEYDLFRNQLSLPERTHIEKVAFLKNDNNDFLQLRHVSSGVGYYVSEKMRMEIISKGCTGIVFLETE